MKKLLLILFVLFSNSLFSQTYNLCGVWFGYPYYNDTTGQAQIEVIIITQIGQSVIAVKFTGDTAVPKGSVTFFIPKYTQQNVGLAYLITGGPGFPNSGCGGINNMTIPDSTHINWVINYTKATQLQIDSMGMNLDSLGVCCNGSVTGMLNEVKLDDMKLDVNPNPYTNTCTIIFKIKTGKLILTTLEGVQIKQYEVSGSSTLELNGEVLNGVRGTFMVSLIGDDGKTLSKKVTFMK